jgi:hypothetical protein
MPNHPKYYGMSHNILSLANSHFFSTTKCVFYKGSKNLLGFLFKIIYKDQDKVSKFSFYIISPVLYVLVLAIWKGYGLDPVLTPKNDNPNTNPGVSKSDTLHCFKSDSLMIPNTPCDTHPTQQYTTIH